MFPFWFRSFWSLLMLLVTAGGAVWPMVPLMMSERQAWILEMVVTSLNGLLVFMWLTFVILNFVSYRPSDDAIKGDRNTISYFTMEQVQQFLSELSLYPQLCLAAIQLSLFGTVSYKLVGIFTLNSLLLVTVFSLRIYTIARIWKFVRLYLVRLIFSLITNNMSVIYLLVLLLVTSPVDDYLMQLMIFVIVFITTGWNQFMFYLSHLYEITLQSGVNLIQFIEVSESGVATTEILGLYESRHTQRVIQQIKNLEVFHKNMYVMSMPGSGTLLYFWIFPSLVVALYSVGAYLDNLSSLIPVVVWFFLNAAINYKTLLLSCSAHFTSFVILIFFAAVCMLSGAIAFMMYGLIVFFIALMCICICCCAAADKDSYQN